MTTTHTHLAPEQIEAYLCGLLETDEADQVETLVADCPICADRLARAGELEVRIRQVIENIEVRRQPWRRYAAVAAFAAAAALLLVFAPWRTEPAPMPVAKVELSVGAGAVLSTDGTPPASDRIGADCRLRRAANPGDTLHLKLQPNPGAEDASAWFVPVRGATVPAQKAGVAGVLELEWTVPNGNAVGEVGRLWWGRGDSPPTAATPGWESCVVELAPK